jgi:beta-lactamase regulating signal transducer with metallopeptidase domain
MTIFAWFVALTLRVTVVLAASMALAAALRRAGAFARHRLFTLTAIGLLGLPLLTAVMPRWSLPLAPRWVAESPFGTSPLYQALPRIEASRIVEESEKAASAPAKEAAAPTVASESVAARSEWPLAPLVVGIWLAGVLGNLAGLTRGLRRERRLVATGLPLDHCWRETLNEAQEEVAVHRTVRLLTSCEIPTPSTCGWWRPSVLLPSSAISWPAERRRVVLQHELVHVLRADALRHLLWRLATALYWFHPMVRTAACWASGAREEACDEAVLGLGNRPSVYARHLLEIAESLRFEPLQPPLALSMIDRGQLERRLRVILDPQRLSSSWRLRTGVALAALGGILLCTAAVAPRTRAVAPPAAVREVALAAESAQAAEPACVDGIHGNFEGTFNEGPAGTDLNGSYDGGFALQQHLGAGQRLCARVRGAVRLDERDGSILTLPRGSSVLVETREGSRSQRMLVTEEQGQPHYQWWVNGEARTLDAGAQGWLRDALEVMASYRLIGSIQGHVGSLQGEIGSIQGQVGSLQGQIGSIQGQEGSLQGKLGEIQGEEGSLQGEVGSEQGAIGSLQGSRWQADAAQQRKIDNEIASHEAAIRKIEAEIAARRFPERIAAAEKDVRAFADVEAKGRIAEIERRIKDVQAPKRIAEIERQIEDLHAQDRITEIERRMQPALERLKGEAHRISALKYLLAAGLS